MELRKEVRYRLDVPALFYWDNIEKRRLHGEGITRDISVFGAFIVSPTCPPVEVPLLFEVILPSLPGTMPVVRIKGEARVVRVDHPDAGQGENGFAVVSMDLRRWSLAAVDNNFPLTVAEEPCEVMDRAD
jgi:hypothetical protein